MNSNDNVKVVFERAFGDHYDRYLRKVERYKINTIEQLWSIISLTLPELTQDEIRRRGFYQSYNKAARKCNTNEQKIITIQKIYNIGKKDAHTIFDELANVSYPQRSHRLSKDSVSCGVILGKSKSKKTFWQNNPQIRISNSFYIIPDYHRMGVVFDQGQRGTCVANAATSLVDYLTNELTSRQFLYHQCKMIDGCKDGSGTYMWVPMSILNNEELIDYGNVKESDWRYNSNWENSEHQGPPPEKCFKTNRFIGHEIVCARTSSIITDIKTLIVGSNIAEPVPVTVGLPVYSSFFNSYAERTGWINMPLPDDIVLGGHAMLIVGYSDEHEVFIVRNSWGMDWAAENPFNLPGHALIPYDYFSEYCAPGDAVTLCTFDSSFMKISEKDRLYMNPVNELEKHARAAKNKDDPPPKHRKRKKHLLKKLFYIIVIVILLILIIRIIAPDIYFLLRYWIYELYYRISFWLSDKIQNN